MNKDALYATLIGLGIGLLLTGIILVGPNIAKSFPKMTLPTISIPKSFSISLPKFTLFSKKTTPTPTPTTAAPHAVTIDSPLPDAIESTETVLVSGSTSIHSQVVIQGLVDDVVILTNGEGKYAGKITLSEGKNEVVVTSYNQGNTATKTIDIYYTPEDW